ncbi:maltose permease [Colletotrichum musicola]|uniref:Maltose permease n=1 Tax=Colletotrichum musicola TaxID=2175873 RepID=A0A8H6NM99_9PEZI|nr:maltose permease [Colletotrichum musicola]
MTFGEPAGQSYIIPALWLGLWNALVQLGIMIGASINSWLIEKFGRRIGFSSGGFIGSADDRVAIFDDSSFRVSCGLHTSEIFHELCSFKTLLRSPLPLSGHSLAAVLIGFVIPESSAYLVRKGRAEDAAASWRRLHSGITADAEFATLEASVVRESAVARQEADQSATVLQCFRGTDARRTRIIIWSNLLQQLVGIALIANATVSAQTWPRLDRSRSANSKQYFLQLTGMSAQLSLLITQIGISCSILAYAISWYTMTKFGRRSIMLWSAGIVSVLWLSIGVAGCFQSHSNALWYIGIALLVISFVLASGVRAAWPVVSAEASSIRLRSQSQTVAWVANVLFSWVFMFVVPYLFNMDEANLGGKIGFIFAGLSVLGFILIFLEIPEMKVRSYIEIDYMFEQKLPTRMFKTYFEKNWLSTAEIKCADERFELSHRE